MVIQICYHHTRKWWAIIAWLIRWKTNSLFNHASFLIERKEIAKLPTYELYKPLFYKDGVLQNYICIDSDFKNGLHLYHKKRDDILDEHTQRIYLSPTKPSAPNKNLSEIDWLLQYLIKNLGADYDFCSIAGQLINDNTLQDDDNFICSEATSLHFISNGMF